MLAGMEKENRFYLLMLASAIYFPRLVHLFQKKILVLFFITSLFSSFSDLFLVYAFHHFRFFKYPPQNSPQNPSLMFISPIWKEIIYIIFHLCNHSHIFIHLYIQRPPFSSRSLPHASLLIFAKLDAL